MSAHSVHHSENKTVVIIVRIVDGFSSGKKVKKNIYASF